MIQRSLARRRGFPYMPKGSQQDYTASFRHSFLGGQMGPQDGSVPPGMSPSEFDKYQRLQQNREGMTTDPEEDRFQEAVQRSFGRADAFGGPMRSGIPPKAPEPAPPGEDLPRPFTTKQANIDSFYMWMLTGVIAFIIFVMSVAK